MSPLSPSSSPQRTISQMVRTDCSPEKGQGAFGEAAQRLAGAAAMLLGWRPDEFWNATPAEMATALTRFSSEAEGPDPDSIAALRLRFPDEE